MPPNNLFCIHAVPLLVSTGYHLQYRTGSGKCPTCKTKPYLTAALTRLGNLEGLVPPKLSLAFGALSTGQNAGQTPPTVSLYQDLFRSHVSLRMNRRAKSIVMGISVEFQLALLAAFVLLYFLDCLRLVAFTPLRKIPGPFFARISGLYRLTLVASGRAPENYRAVHDRYGRIARVGPNHVSISDPMEIPTIYGLGSKFLKVSKHPDCRSLALIDSRPLFIQY